MGAIVVCVFIFGKYTKRHTVGGQLVPDVGVVRVFPPQSGIVIEKRIVEGQKIEKGNVLYVVSSERASADTNTGVQEAVSHQVALRQQSLREELVQTHRLHGDEEKTLRKKIDGLEEERTNIAHQIAGQRARLDLAEEAKIRVAKLLLQGYVSKEMAQQKQADLLDQKSRLDILERDSITITRELMKERAELAALPLRQHNQIAQIDRLLANADQEWAESEGRRRIAVVAPESGIASVATAEVGQTVDGTKSIVSIIPDNAVLQAYLYVPSRAIGFVKVGAPVLLRYQAFPYQKFGHAHGVVAEVSRITMPPEQMNNTQFLGSVVGEPFYRIAVSLKKQKINAYGQNQNLTAGMLLEADILLEERRLFEWALEPLYSLKGKI
jgi:membrane fusion protein